MEKRKNVACSWSGGKDCCFALMEVKAMGYTPKVLLNMMNKDERTSRSHGLPVAMLEEQAKAMNLTLLSIPTAQEDYEENFIKALKILKDEYNIDYIVYGDIDLVVHREWQERVCKIAGMEAFLPLWNRKREVLAQEIANSGIETIIVSCNLRMGEKFLGRVYNSELIQEFIEMGIDTCGEDGEFHSMVVDGPLFQHKITIPELPRKTTDKFCYIDWEY